MAEMQQAATEQTEAAQAASVQEAETAGAGDEAEFETLIRGRFKEQFDARVQRILDGRLKNLKQENQQHQQTAQRETQRQKEQLAQLAAQSDEIRTVYPDFDWQREMRAPQFARLIAAGVDGRTAYETMHRDEVLRRAVRYGAQRAGEQISRSIASGGGRIAENGGGAAGSVSRMDPRSLSATELADIRRRVMRGEKIRF